jgi:NAD(P)-dependent dehydrogenase (short-subunit alcohol dehydrogenase family)
VEMPHCVVMRILIIGATGTIGRPVVAALHGRHELVLASKNKAEEKVDIADPASIRALFKRAGKFDAIVVAAGDAAFKPFAQLQDEDFALSIRSKLMGQVNVVRYGMDSVNDGGSFTLTSGTLAEHPMQNGAAASTVNGAINSFARAAAHEAPRGIRVNAVAPPWITETLVAYKMNPEGGMPATDVARAYAEAVEGRQTGQIIAPAFSSRR